MGNRQKCKALLVHLKLYSDAELKINGRHKINFFSFSSSWFSLSFEK
jgi:hypothetical protein